MIIGFCFVGATASGSNKWERGKGLGVGVGVGVDGYYYYYVDAAAVEICCSVPTHLERRRRTHDQDKNIDKGVLPTSRP